MREHIAVPLLRQVTAAGGDRVDAVERLNVGLERIKQLCRKYEIALPLGRRPFVPKRHVEPSPRPRVSMLHSQAVAKCAEEGLTRRAAADRLGLSYATVVKIAIRGGIKFDRARKRTTPDSRVEDMAALYRAGHTLQAIGDQYDLTRERVRQILTRDKGITGADGGFRAKARVRQERAVAARDGRHLAKYGCTYAQWREIRDFGKAMRAQGIGAYRTPLPAFRCQRNNAHHRGIGWDLTLWQWWQIWQASGRWGQRGRGQGYVMCRIGDEGPYAPGNVFIALAAENSSERRQKKSTLPRGVKIRHGKFAAVRQIGGKKYERHGFATPELAHAAYLRMGMAETAQTLAA